MSMRLLKDPATVNSRIFVGHLITEDTNKAELEEYFSKYGTVIGSAINRGFGFIQFENDQAAQNAIKNENGAMFKGRRIDVKPAKKDPIPSGGQLGSGGSDSGNPNNSFSGGNQGGPNSMKPNFGNDNQFSGNDQFNSGNQNRSGNNSFGGGSINPNQPFANQNQFSGGNQNRSGMSNKNYNNSNNQDLNQNKGGPGGGGIGGIGGIGGMGRGKNLRGGKNKIKSRQENMAPGGIFRDRSPLGRGNDKWDMNMPGFRNNFNDSGGRFDPPGPIMRESFGGNSGSADYSMTAEKNDCEIIVVSKALTEYAEMIESRLKKMGLTVDLLFPNEDVPLSRVLGNIASRGCLYAVVVTPINQEHRSLTLNILHGLPQEHRNMPVDDAINLISRDYSNYKSGGRSVPLNAPMAKDRHPDAIQVLLNMLADNHQLTVLQYDRVLKYLEVKREEQVQLELGDVSSTSIVGVNDPKQAELQSRILNILNSNKTTSSAPNPVPAPTSVVPTSWPTASTVATSTTTSSSAATAVTPSPLLNDPTVQKALDSLLQGNLLKNIGDQQPAATTATTAATTTSPAPLFAAFPNINRF